MRKAVFIVLIGIVLLGLAAMLERYFLRRQPLQFRTSSQETGSGGEVKEGSDGARQIAENYSIRKFGTSETNLIPMSSFKGKIVLLNFWASWCSACMSEMPSINKLYDSLKEEPFEVLAINVDENPMTVVPEIIKKLDLHFGIYLDPQGGLAERFDVVAIPYSVILGKNLNVLWSESGERNWYTPEIQNEIRKLAKSP